MGLFDSVYAECPTCGGKIEFQSKADDDPYMNNYTVEDAPAHILYDVLNEPEYCRNCCEWSCLYDPYFAPEAERPRPAPKMVRVRQPTDPTIHATQTFLRWWNEPFTSEDIIP